MFRKFGHRPLALLAPALLLAGLLVTLRPPSRDYLDLLRQAEGHAAQTERTAAAAAYREAVQVCPNAPLPHVSLARLYLDWGRMDEALDAVDAAERLGADPVELAQLRVAIYTACAETSFTARPAHWKAVAEHARRLLALESDAQEVRHVLARAYLGLRRWEAAQSVYRELIRMDRGDKQAHERLGALLLMEDRSAVEHLRIAQTELSHELLAAFAAGGTSGDPAYAGLRIGRVLIEREEWPLAARQLELSVSHNPKYVDAQAYLGHVLDHMGYPDEAGPRLLWATQAAPDSPVAHTLLGLHYDRLGDTVAARAEYEIVYDLAPENPAICVEIGQTWSAEGRYVAAEIWLREAVSLRPNDPGLWEILARFYLQNGITSDERAVRAAEKLLDLVPAEAEAHDLRGWAALEVGAYETAQEHLQRAIELDPGLASAHYHLGLLQRARGHSKRAQAAFTRALDLDTTGEFRSLIQRARQRDDSAENR